MKRLLSIFLVLAIAITLALPVTADASAESDSLAWQGSRVNTSLAVSGTAKYYQHPSTESSSSNPSLGTISSPYISAIGKNGSGVWYYQISAGGVTAYAQASSFTPNYDAAGYFYFNFLDSNGRVVSPTSPGEYSFVNTSRMHAMVHNHGADAVTVDTVSVAVKNSSGTQITGGTVSPGTTGSYEITENSSLASQVDFSRLSVGTVYTMTVTATFTNHYHPSSSTSVTNRSFTKTWSFNIRVTQGQVSVTTSGLRVPTANMTYGEKYTLKGTITATGANLSAVSAYVYWASDTNYTNNLTGTYDLVNAPSYSIQGSKLDNGCKFATLAEGDYVYVLRAEAGGKGFLLNATPFTVVKPSYTINYWSGDGQFNVDGQVTKNLQQNKAYGATIELFDDVPVQSHCSFLGWDTSDTATTVRYHPGDTYSANANLSLYAVYKPDEYTITYDACGGPEAPPTEIFYGSKRPMITDTEPVWPGHTFLGWNERPNTNWTEYSPGQRLDEYRSYYLYAIWKKVPVSILTDGGTLGNLDGSGIITGENLSGHTAYYWYNVDVVDLSKIVFDSPKPGHYLLGWEVMEPGSVVFHQINDKFTFRNEDSCGLRAIWALSGQENQLILPDSLIVVEDEAFAGSLAEQVEFPEGIQRIGSRAFADCKELRLVKIPVASVEIADDAFSWYPNTLRFYAPAGGSVEEYANAHGFGFIASE